VKQGKYVYVHGKRNGIRKESKQRHLVVLASLCIPVDLVVMLR